MGFIFTVINEIITYFRKMLYWFLYFRFANVLLEKLVDWAIFLDGKQSNSVQRLSTVGYN